MRNSYWNGRARRDVSQVNYNESSEEDFDSPLQSPQRPPPTRAGSPVELAVPTLADNVDEELEAVSRQLRNVGHTHTFRGTRPEVRPDPEGGEVGHNQPEDGPGEAVAVVEEVTAEEVVEGVVVQHGDNHKLGAENGGGGGSDDNGAGGSDDNGAGDDEEVAVMVDFDAENKDDGEKSQDLARSIRVEFNKNDIVFWFSELEGEMEMASVGSQWLKRTILKGDTPKN